MSADRIQLSDLVSSLRSEITKAWQEGEYDTVGFEAGAIEVELTTQIEVVQVHGKVSAKFWVLNAEAETGRTSTNTQRINFSLMPKDRRDPTKPLMITGRAAPGERRPEITAEDQPAGSDGQPAR